jgi:IclR family transcriptional regulator, acetate operon repressor
MTLHDAGWIEVADPKRGSWLLSLKALIVAGRAAEGQAQLRNIAVPVMEECRRASGETIHLSVRQGSNVILVERLDGILPVTQFRPYGSGAPLGLTAPGKAILAALPKEELDDFLSRPLPGRTAMSVTDPVKLREELNVVKSQGYASALGSNGNGVGAVGAAICDASGRPFAAISASGPLSRMTPERTVSIGPTMRDAAQRIGMGIAWSPAR